MLHRDYLLRALKWKKNTSVSGDHNVSFPVQLGSFLKFISPALQSVHHALHSINKNFALEK